MSHIHHIPIPAAGAACQVWRDYYRLLSGRFGALHARQLWLFTWKHRGQGTCTSDPAFRRWLEKQQLDVGSTASGFVADISQIGKNFMGLGKNMSRVLSIGLPVTLGLTGLALVYLLYHAAKRPDLIAGLHPAGRSAAVLKSLS